MPCLSPGDLASVNVNKAIETTSTYLDLVTLLQQQIWSGECRAPLYIVFTIHKIMIDISAKQCFGVNSHRHALYGVRRWQCC